jgi:DNA-binding CsgD family transcriptional regulator
VAGDFATEYVVAVTNLSDVLDVAGRTEEALEEIQAAMQVVRAHPERTVYDTFMEAQGVNLMLRLGRLSEFEHELPTAKFGDDIGNTARLVCQLRARLAVLTGDLRVAQRELEEQRRMCKGTVDPQWMEPLYGALAELALLEDRIEDARQAIRDGIGLLEGSQDGVRIMKLLWIGLMVEATAAERDRALGEGGRDGRAEELLAMLPAAEALPGQWVEGPLYAALARAEMARARVASGDGEPDPGAWEAVAARFAELSYPWPTAYAGFRAAEAYVQAGDRAAAAAPLTAARTAAQSTRATPLLDEIDALARRARLSVRAVAQPEPEPDPDDPAARLGLTPREHEVLLLVAAGRTNREIGAELFMSEKTASVHVSRILAKLGVSGRVEAAAVAHRLGLVAV